LELWDLATQLLPIVISACPGLTSLRVPCRDYDVLFLSLDDLGLGEIGTFQGLKHLNLEKGAVCFAVPLCFPALVELSVCFDSSFDFDGIEKLIHLKTFELRRFYIVDIMALRFDHASQLAACPALTSVSICVNRPPIGESSLLTAIKMLVRRGQLQELTL
jgi:hypothetical protein